MRLDVLIALAAGSIIPLGFEVVSSAAPPEIDPTATAVMSSTDDSTSTTTDPNAPTTTTLTGETTTTTTPMGETTTTVPGGETTTTVPTGEPTTTVPTSDSTTTTTPQSTTSAPTTTIAAETTTTTTPEVTTTTVEPAPLDTAVRVDEPTTTSEPPTSAPATQPTPPPTRPATSSGGSGWSGPIEGHTSMTPIEGRTAIPGRLTAESDVDVIMATIRRMESGGRYDIKPNKAGASGAYQYIKSTWNNFGGYPEAYFAPPDVQDQRARMDVERLLWAFHGDVSIIPVMWYYPLASRDVTWMDRVPNPAGGNRLTVRQYQTRWMGTWTQQSREAAESAPTLVDGPAAVTVLSQFPPTLAGDDPAAVPPTTSTDPRYQTDVVTVADSTMQLAARSAPPVAPPSNGAADELRQIVFPVLGPAFYDDTWGAPRDGGARHHEGTDIIGVAMQPLLAAVDGTIVTLQPANSGRSGVRITIKDADGWRYNYFHVNDDTPGSDDGTAADIWRYAPGISVGQQVKAGQIIGYMGDSGNAETSVSHLHFEFRDPRGIAHPSFASLKAAEERQKCTIGLGPWSVLPAPAPADGIVPPPVQVTTVIPLFGSGVWQVDTDGRVTATGDAALIEPGTNLNCPVGPRSAFGSDAAGWSEATFDSSQLVGTVLDGVDMKGTSLLPFDPIDPVQLIAADERTATPVETKIFHDPASGEVILLPQPATLPAAVAPAPAIRLPVAQPVPSRR
jgi:murein DD-endopeptidase MepM/ murein hydrolase activator NlpD